MCTPSSASLAVESYTASTPASFVVDPCSASSHTSGASVVSTPLSTAYSCNDCTRRAKRSHNLQRANNRLKTKVQSLKKEVSSLRHTITELESVSFIYLHNFAINIFANLFLMAIHVQCICIYSLICLPCFFFSPSQENDDL